jgi:hypothetical protein
VIYRLVVVIVLAGALALVINSLPDIKRYVEIRKM